MVGSLGNDTLYGGNGNDIAIFKGNLFDYSIVFFQDGFHVSDSIQGRDDTDFLKYDIEAVRFADGEYSLRWLQSFDSVYRQMYPEIDWSKYKSAFEYHLFKGKNEARLTLKDFNESLYRMIHTGVDQALREGTIPDAIHHLVNHGLSEGRASNFTFDEAAYRARYLDIDAEIKQGKIPSALYHYIIWGYREGRMATFVVNKNGKLFGGNGNDEIKGSQGNDTLLGAEGNDIIFSFNGNDFLDGGIGNDTMIGGLGNDTYVVDSTGDVVTETSTLATEIDTVQSSVSYTLGANLEKLILTGSAAINGTGNSLNNTITGNTANNILNGGAGNDTMIGGLGNDIYIVDATGDVVTESSTLATEIDTVQSSVSYTLSANLEKLVLTGSAAINGTGNSISNAITGNAANNTLNGAAGNDILSGRAGADILTGGLGADRFVYPDFKDSLLAAPDRITDFNPSGGDRIVVNTPTSLPTALFNAGIFSTASYSTLNAAAIAAYADVNPNLTGTQALAVKQAVFFGWNGGTYLSVNDSTAAFNATTDLLINVTGMTGTLATGALTPNNYFAL
ncbi:calcium-binding protein [Nostoc sp. TCL26-01]|nr:calcium-binding protein [Nostoc sp. TCL26-01]